MTTTADRIREQYLYGDVIKENIDLRFQVAEKDLVIKKLQEKCDLLENCVLAYELEFQTIIQQLGD